MWELLKVAVDVAVLRDGARKGQLNWRVFSYAFGFVLMEYAIALPAVLLYDKHSEYKPLFIAAMALDGLLFVIFFWLGMRWYVRSLAAHRAAAGQRPDQF